MMSAGHPVPQTNPRKMLLNSRLMPGSAGSQSSGGSGTGGSSHSSGTPLLLSSRLPPPAISHSSGIPFGWQSVLLWPLPSGHQRARHHVQTPL